MKTDAERFGVLRTDVGDNYDSELLLSVATTFARYADHVENRLMSFDFMRLVRLIRANPARLVETVEEFRQLYEPAHPRQPVNWNPNAGYGMKLFLSPRNPLVRMLRTHYPSDHRVWTYITVGTRRYH